MCQWLALFCAGDAVWAQTGGPSPTLPSAGREAVPNPRITIGYVEIEADSRYEPIHINERLILKTRDRPLAGAQVGVDEALALARVLWTDFGLERIVVKTADQLVPQVIEALQARDIHFFLIDAPAEAIRQLAAGVRGRDLLLFNVTEPDDALRREFCAAEVIHTAPSLAMSMDGLAQFLVARKWRDVLVLEGPLRNDALMTNAFLLSAKKFGARIVAHNHFKVGTDPREREFNNPALLSATVRDHDVVFVADEAFEFVRQVSYRTVRARPVVGSSDLEAVGWHWTWEHNGAPQVNSRFQRRSGGRRMQGADWAAWIAVKMVVQSALRTRSVDFRKQREFILGGAGFDGDKGLAVSIRPWDQQLRQAVFLATPYAVVASAPMEGFLHRTNDLDTLGDDEADSPCRMRK